MLPDEVVDSLNTGTNKWPGVMLPDEVVDSLNTGTNKWPGVMLPDEVVDSLNTGTNKWPGVTLPDEVVDSWRNKLVLECWWTVPGLSTVEAIVDRYSLMWHLANITMTMIKTNNATKECYLTTLDNTIYKFSIIIFQVDDKT